MVEVVEVVEVTGKPFSAALPSWMITLKRAPTHALPARPSEAMMISRFFRSTALKPSKDTGVWPHVFRASRKSSCTRCQWVSSYGSGSGSGVGIAVRSEGAPCPDARPEVS